MTRVCVLFDHFDPSHWARLDATGKALPTLGLEMSPKNGKSGSARFDVGTSFRRITMFGKGDGRNVPAREIVRRVGLALDEYQPSAVAIPGWSDTASLAALSWCVQAGRPSILMSDSHTYDLVRRWAKDTLKRLIIDLFSGGLVGGAPQADYLAALGMPRERIFAGYDVVDNDHFSNGADTARRNAGKWRERLNLPENYFLARHRFTVKNNLHRLVEAYAAYQKTAGPAAWKLVLIGGGPLEHQLRGQIEQLRLGSFISLVGFIPYEDLPIYYALAEAFVYPSSTEQWGLAINEAMACGLPILASQTCGCVSSLVVNYKNGFTFDPLSTTALSALLSRVSGKDCDRAGMGRASQAIIAQWTPQTFAANLQRAIQTSMETPRQTRATAQRMLLQKLLRKPCLTQRPSLNKTPARFSTEDY